MVQLSHPYWKTHSFDYTELCQQSDVSLSRFDSFPSKDQVSMGFLAAVTIHSDFGAQENKICHCFHFFPSILAKDLWLTLFQETTLILSSMTY